MRDLLICLVLFFATFVLIHGPITEQDRANVRDLWCTRVWVCHD